MDSKRKYIIGIFFGIFGVLFLVRLFFLQVLDNQYKINADRNSRKRIIEYPYRGLILDRNDRLLTINKPVFDLFMDPHKAKIKDTTAFINLFGIDYPTFKRITDKAKRIPRPTAILKEISSTEFAKIQSHLVNYPGFYITSRTTRGYPHQSLGNTLGYMNEISPKALKQDTTNFYKAGDYIGISGIEKKYEKELRGKRGVQYQYVNVFGANVGSFLGGKSDTLSVPGRNIKTSIDLTLQKYAEKLLKGKRGSIIALEPSTGEILAIVSGPFYDPNLLTGRNTGINFQKLNQDTLKPLFNRPIQAVYPPGSIFKTVQSLVALQENVIGANEKIYCDGSLIGDHAPPGYYDVIKGIKYSSNNYFYKVFKRIIEQGKDPNPFKDARMGLENWRTYMYKFGLGRRLGIDIPNENKGFVPTATYYDKYYRKYAWRMSTIYSLAIGQGELQLTPLQMANLAAIMANRGWYKTPHLVKEIGEGETIPAYNVIRETGIDQKHFAPVIEGMSQALAGTAGRAIIKDIDICGKTGTVENPPLPDHSVFMCFAPRDNPVIALSVYVENAGWGGRASASIASLLVEKYIKGEISRKYLEDFVLKGDFLF